MERTGMATLPLEAETDGVATTPTAVPREVGMVPLTKEVPVGMGAEEAAAIPAAVLEERVLAEDRVADAEALAV